ncbi:hypothetical protein ACOMHN_018938 [Nucella lapillus]
MSVKTAVSEGLSSRKLIEAKLSDAGGFKEEFGWDPAYTEDAEDIGDERRDRIYDLFNQGIALETQKKDVQELQEQDPTLECVRRCLTRPARPNAVAVYVKNDGLLYRRHQWKVMSSKLACLYVNTACSSNQWKVMSSKLDCLYVNTACSSNQWKVMSSKLACLYVNTACSSNQWKVMSSKLACLYVNTACSSNQ